MPARSLTGRFDGMTVNARIYSAGLEKKFSRAIEERNRAVIVRLLLRVEFTSDQAEYIADNVLARPNTDTPSSQR